jgi:nickel/cobalt exporter
VQLCSRPARLPPPDLILISPCLAQAKVAPVSIAQCCAGNSHTNKLSVMPVKTIWQPNVLHVAVLAAAVIGLLLVAGLLDAALAQGAPFGAPRAQAPTVPVGGVLGWIFAKQAEFYRQFSSLIRAAKADGTAPWGLLGLSFLYGIFHAAGPGHGKAVISSYLVANQETWTRGVVLSFASALLQALVAVAVVGVAAALLNATAATMSRAVNAIEIVSYSLIIVIGVRLLWVKGRACIAALRTLHRPAAVGAAVTPAHLRHGDAHHVHDDHVDCRHDHHDHDHDHHHHDHDHDHHHHDAGHAHHHDCDDHASAWGHAHAPEPEELAGPGGWKRGFSAIVAVGLRPCSGAILVLVFALAQGLFWAGVASTFVMGIGTAITVAVIASIAVGARAWAQHLADARSGYGLLAMRAIEVGAAVVIIAFGALLLTGYIVTERMVGI